MNRRFVIQWKSKVNGRAGRGSKEFERDDAERIATELNTEYPDIEHQVVPAPETPPGAPEPEARAPENRQPEATPPSRTEEHTLSE